MKARLVVKFTAGPLIGQSFSIGGDEELVFGSDPRCLARIEGDPDIGRMHARLSIRRKRNSATLVIEDIGSVAGTFVNGRRISKRTRLSPGDRVSLGRFSTFQFSTWNALAHTRISPSLLLSRVTEFKDRRVQELRGAARGPQGPQRDLSPGRTWGSSLWQARWPVIAIGVAGALLTLILIWKQKPVEADDPRILVDETSQGASTGRNAPPLRIAANARPLSQPVPLPPRDKRKLFVWDEIVNISQRFGDTPPSALQPDFLAEVEASLDFYTRNGNHHRLLREAERYRETIESALTNSGLPAELGAVVWVESAYRTDAYNPSGARGMWQFLPDTARENGLEVSDNPTGLDERLDPRKSSFAAARYFRKLLHLFGSNRYLLAIASYNLGQNKVRRSQLAESVRHARLADFWNIKEQLPEETKHYVPKVLAAIIISRHPDKW